LTTTILTDCKLEYWLGGGLCLGFWGCVGPAQLFNGHQFRRGLAAPSLDNFLDPEVFEIFAASSRTVHVGSKSLGAAKPAASLPLSHHLLTADDRNSHNLHRFLQSGLFVLEPSASMEPRTRRPLIGCCGRLSQPYHSTPRSIIMMRMLFPPSLDAILG
jgi:hypothetical protein